MSHPTRILTICLMFCLVSAVAVRALASVLEEEIQVVDVSTIQLAKIRYCANGPLTPVFEDVPLLERPRTLAAVRADSTASPQVILNMSDLFLTADYVRNSTVFALYDDGTVIFRQDEEYKSIRLSSMEHRELLHSIDQAELPDLAGRYHVSPWNHEPSGNLLIYTNHDPVLVSVYGSLRNSEVQSCLPPNLGAVLSELMAFRHPGAETWLPNEIEVMIWDLPNTPDASVIWPDQWPGLDDPQTVRTGDDMYSIFVLATHFDEVQGLLASIPIRGVVEIDGRAWGAEIRFPFPHEELWTGFNRELAVSN